MKTWINILLLSILGSTIFSSKAINLNKNYLNNISNSQYNNNIDPTYPTFKDKQTWYDSQRVCWDGGTCEPHPSSKTISFNWRQYADDWNTFKKNYSSFTIGIYASANSRYNSSTLTDRTFNTSVISSNRMDSGIGRYNYNKFLSNANAHYENYGSNSAYAGYYLWHDSTYIYVFLSLVAQTQKGGIGETRGAEASLNYKGITFHSSFSLQNVKNNLNYALNKEISLTSDYSGSLEDKKNINDPTGKGNDLTTLLTTTIKNVLGNEYSKWKPYIQPFSFNNSTRKATTVFKFRNSTTGNQEIWTFETPVNIKLSENYWGKSLRGRLNIFPGQIVNPNDSTQGMVPDKPIQLEPDKVSDTYGGTLEFHTTAHLQFDGLNDSSEWMTVNGQPVEVINNKFVYNMKDQRVMEGKEATNIYDIVVNHDDETNKAKYRIKYKISNLVPTLLPKWYAWDPAKNPNQNDLIVPSIDGKPNPKYDPEVNPETGTKTQILWVKKKSKYPFPLDPLNKYGEVIDPKRNPGDYDLGFLAEGSVVGMGVQQLFNPAEVSEVWREGVNSNLISHSNPTEREQLTKIKPDSVNKYWSWEGFWHYITKTNDNLAYEKYVLIGAKYQDKYPRFLDILGNNNIAVDFWTTIHGIHLKNYLIDYKKLDLTKISKLNFEQVASYWKEYTSDIIAQRIPPDPNPADFVDISGNFPAIKMNEIDVNKIRSLVLAYAQNYINQKASGAKLGIDYYVVTKEGIDISSNADALKPLLDNLTEPKYLDIIIKTKQFSSILIGEANGSIKNSRNYDPEKVKDLSKIKFNNQKFNFAGFSIEEIKNWIIKYINLGLKKSGYTDLVFNKDYGISINDIPPTDENHNNVPGYFNDEIFSDFLNNLERSKKITIVVYANDASDLAEGKTEFVLENYINGDKPDPDPTNPTNPVDPIEPNPNPTNPTNPEIPTWGDKKYLRWLLPVIIIPIIGIIIGIIWFYFRFKKRIR